MGTIYLARQLSLARQVALKTIRTHWTGHPHVMARFTREAYAAAQLTHHNVVQIYDLGGDRDLFANFNPGIAGVMLLCRSLFRGGRMSLFALPAAVVIVMGPSLGIPGIAALGGPNASSAVIGLSIGALGVLFGRTSFPE